MSEAKLVTLSSQELHQLATAKLHAAGLPEQQAIEAANHLLYADESGILTWSDARGILCGTALQRRRNLASEHHLY